MSEIVKVSNNFKDSAEIQGSYMEKYNPYDISRYRSVGVIFDDDYHYRTLYPENMKIDADNYYTYIVSVTDKNRLDLIAYKFYGDAKLFWVIGYFNDIIDPFNVPRGTELKIPDIAALYKFGGVLS